MKSTWIQWIIVTLKNCCCSINEMSIIIEMHYYFWIFITGFVATSAGIPAKLNQVIILFCEQGWNEIVPTLATPS